jgi:2-polyprenyl-6-methoxyphenol hydroxylase-like FAD-dependent oxidoreductase
MIVGAGIGGLTAAVALQRAGRDVVVFEQFEQLLEVGAGFTLNSNAVTALRSIGLDSAVVDHGAILTTFVHRTHDGKVLATWATGTIGDNLGSPIVGMSRPQIQHILLGALRDPDIRFGHRFAGVEQDDSGVTARFADGTEARGAVLVGADGSQSAVRAAFDSTPRRYSGYTTWLALSSGEAFAPGTHTQWYGRSLIFGSHPVGDGRSYWYAGQSVPPGGRDADAKQHLLGLFGDWHDPVPAMIETTDTINRSDIYDLDRRSSWGRGRATLLGDAAHPMAPALGQGACQAIEDAVILARFLGSGDSDVDALRAYEQRRIARTAPIVKRARMQGKLMQGDNAAIRAVRYSSFRFAPEKQVLKSFQKLLTFPG